MKNQGQLLKVMSYTVKYIMQMLTSERTFLFYHAFTAERHKLFLTLSTVHKGFNISMMEFSI